MNSGQCDYLAIIEIVVTQLLNNKLPNRLDERITLGPLDLAAAGSIVGTSRAAELHALTGGNPLFLRQLAVTDHNLRFGPQPASAIGGRQTNPHQ